MQFELDGRELAYRFFVFLLGDLEIETIFLDVDGMNAWKAEYGFSSDD